MVQTISITSTHISIQLIQLRTAVLELTAAGGATFSAHRSGAQLPQLGDGATGGARRRLRDRAGDAAALAGGAHVRLYRLGQRVPGCSGDHPGAASRVRLAGYAAEGRRTWRLVTGMGDCVILRCTGGRAESMPVV